MKDNQNVNNIKLPYTHLLYVRKYSILTNNYDLYVYGVNTKDIYHVIGELVCRSFEHIKRIDWVECCQENLNYWSERNIPILEFKEKYNNLN